MKLLLCLLIPALAALGIRMLRRRPNLREAVTIAASALLFLVVLSLYAQGGAPALVLGELMPGLELRIEI